MSVSKAKTKTMAGAKARAARRMAGALAAGVVALTGTLTGAGSAQAAYDPVTHTMWNDEPLYRGWHIDNGDNTRLIMQDDGNLVVYRWFNDPSRKEVRWASNTVGCGDKAVMQSDGNLVVYGGDGRRVCYARNEFKGSYANGCLSVWKGGIGIYFTNEPCPQVAARQGDFTITLRKSDAY
ncbi:hypothetical protein OOK31_19635 [Streptomyces sp. NBC_00249]|uniref:hypothetical protein n=1 Tax=Streptomyces sp. NBC_00249 TaxID=2975690 RepID=UPI00224DDAD6|nr:hypothetical protein [Streptomyces sp. NBC_00249]MCX5196079.1 hypothetical protein [Streptomyces sp. NBC_00249]